MDENIESRVLFVGTRFSLYVCIYIQLCIPLGCILLAERFLRHR